MDIHAGIPTGRFKFKIAKKNSSTSISVLLFNLYVIFGRRKTDVIGISGDNVNVNEKVSHLLTNICAT